MVDIGTLYNMDWEDLEKQNKMFDFGISEQQLTKWKNIYNKYFTSLSLPEEIVYVTDYSIKNNQVLGLTSKRDPFVKIENNEYVNTFIVRDYWRDLCLQFMPDNPIIINYISVIYGELTRDQKKALSLVTCGNENDLKSQIIKIINPIFNCRFHGDLKEGLMWLFNQDSNFLDLKNQPSLELSDRFYYIINVITIKNTRYVFSINKNNDLIIRVVNPDYRGYNYLDPDRWLYFKNLEEFPQIIFTDSSLPSKITDYNAEVTIRGIKKFPILVSNTQINNSIKKHELENKTKQGVIENRIKQTQLYKKQINNLKNKSFNYYDITFYYDKIVYNNQTLQCSSILTKNILNCLGFKDTNWENYFFRFIHFIKEKLSSLKNLSCTIGNISLTLEIKLTKNNSKRIFVNGYRINNKELEQILNYTTCFLTLEEFNAFLSTISKFSLRFHKSVEQGIVCKNINDSFNINNNTFKFILIREKNRIYLKIGDNKIIINDINKFLSLENKRNLNDILKILYNHKIIKLSDELIIETIKESKKEYEQFVEKSKKFLDDTIKLFNLEKITTAIDSYRREGFIVCGKRKKYFIENNLEAKVWTYPEKQYKCIIDKISPVHDQIGYDILVSRIFALANDSFVSQEIHTLNQD